MCWLDKSSVNQMFKLRDKFNISAFIETGTFKGVNARFHSLHWKEVHTCDISDEYFKMAAEKLKDCDNVFLYKQSSPDFLRSFLEKYEKDKRDDIVFIYLDAHFYDPSLPLDEKWVVVNELKALKGFRNCIICIHDFDCEGLGHCCYNGESLGFSLVMEDLMKVNPDFFLYTNTRKFCDIYDEETIADVLGIVLDEDTIDNIKYAHSCDRLTYRGILYCVPEELDLSEFQLKKAEV